MTDANIVATLGVDLRTGDKKFGSERKKREKEVQSEILALEEE